MRSNAGYTSTRGGWLRGSVSSLLPLSPHPLTHHQARHQCRSRPGQSSRVRNRTPTPKTPTTPTHPRHLSPPTRLGTQHTARPTPRLRMLFGCWLVSSLGSPILPPRLSHQLLCYQNPPRVSQNPRQVRIQGIKIQIIVIRGMYQTSQPSKTTSSRAPCAGSRWRSRRGRRSRLRLQGIRGRSLLTSRLLFLHPHLTSSLPIPPPLISPPIPQIKIPEKEL